MLEIKSPCFSSSHGPPGCCMAFSTVSAFLKKRKGQTCSRMALPALALSFHTGWSSPQLHFQFSGEVLLLEAKHRGLICEWRTLPCEGAPALRHFFIGCRCLLSRRTSSRCLLRLCKLWVNYGDAIFSFTCLSKGRRCSLHCIWIYLSTLKIWL